MSLLNNFKKLLGEAGQVAQGVERQLNPFDGGATYNTPQQAPRPVQARPVYVNQQGNRTDMAPAQMGWTPRGVGTQADLRNVGDTMNSFSNSPQMVRPPYELLRQINPMLFGDTPDDGYTLKPPYRY